MSEFLNPKKIKFYTETQIANIQNKKITLSNSVETEPEIVLVAVGRTPNITDKIDGITYLGDASGEFNLLTMG